MDTAAEVVVAAAKVHFAKDKVMVAWLQLG
jgi:hypothetical protein